MHFSSTFFVEICIFAILFFVVAAEYRSIDGTNNNKQNPQWGATGSYFKRDPFPTSYADGISTVRNDLPSARLISNLVFSRVPKNPTSALGLSDITTYWGQFIGHDMAQSRASTAEQMEIIVPTPDQWFDPNSEGGKSLRMRRVNYDPATGTSPSNPRMQINEASSFIDASMIYGHTPERANLLRSFNKGKLLASSSGLYMSLNTDGSANDNNSGFFPNNQLFVSGDVRTNENPMLAAIHTLFMREHNRLCDELAANNSSWDDEKLYQEARRWVIAYIQSITFNEYTTAVLGAPLAQYRGYNDTLQPGIWSLFASAAFRYGHSEVNSVLLRLDESRREIPEKSMLLRDAFFNPTWAEQGIEPLFRGAAHQKQQNVDNFFINDVRNFLFGRTFSSGAMDLAAVNVQRGRDFGLPLYNDARAALGLQRFTTFSQINPSDPELTALIAQAYNNNIDLVDAYTGGICEEHVPNSNVGELFWTMIRTQYQLLRDADRFFYMAPDSGFTEQEIETIESTKLSHIVLRNSNITAIQCQMFWTSDKYDCSLSNNSTDRTKSNTVEFLDGKIVLSWTIVQNTYIDITLEAQTRGWVAVGFNMEKENQQRAAMLGSDVIIGYVTPAGSAVVEDYFIGTTRNVGCPNGVCLDSTQEGGSNDVTQVVGAQTDTATKIQFRRRLITGDQYDAEITNQDIGVIVAMSRSNSDTIAFHGPNKATAVINFLASTASMSHVEYAKTAHGILMVIAWAVLSVFGTFIGRFFKKHFGRFWLQAHLAMQITSVGLALVAFVMAVMFVEFEGRNHFDSAHKICGLLVMVLTLLQVGLGEFTNMSYKPNSKRPTIVTYFHQYSGYIVTLLAWATIFLGLDVRGGVHIVAWIVFSFWIAAVIVTWIVLQLSMGASKREEAGEPQLLPSEVKSEQEANRT